MTLGKWSLVGRTACAGLLVMGSLANAQPVPKGMFQKPPAQKYKVAKTFQCQSRQLVRSLVEGRIKTIPLGIKRFKVEIEVGEVNGAIKAFKLPIPGLLPSEAVTGTIAPGNWKNSLTIQMFVDAGQATQVDTLSGGLDFIFSEISYVRGAKGNEGELVERANDLVRVETRVNCNL